MYRKLVFSYDDGRLKLYNITVLLLLFFISIRLVFMLILVNWRDVYFQLVIFFYFSFIFVVIDTVNK